MPWAGTSTWAPEHDDELRRLLGEKKSFSQIAAEMSRAFPKRFTRNMCCGRASRLGLSTPTGPRPPRQRKGEATAIGIVERTKRRKAEPAFQFKCEPLTGLRIADVVPLNISIYDLTDQTCHWPFGDDPPFVYCGLPVFESCSYCADHVALSTRPWQAPPLNPGKKAPPSAVQPIIPTRKVA